MNTPAILFTPENTIVSVFPEQKHILRGGISIYTENLLRMAGRLIDATYINGHANLVQLQRVEPLPDGRVQLTHTYQPGTPLQEYYQTRPFIEGQRIPKTIDLMPDDLMQEISQLCDGVDHLHTNGIIHRDICPNNLLLSPENSLILYDYETAGTPLMEDHIWEKGIGTIDFAAPEQYPDFQICTRSKKCYFSNSKEKPALSEKLTRPVTTKASDVFSLGATITEILYREILRRGYPGSFDVTDNLKKRMTSVFTPHPFFNSEVGKTLIKAQELDPDQRFQSVAEFEENLRLAVRKQLSKTQANRLS